MPQQPTPAPARRFAGFWIRLCAALIDGVILFLTALVVAVVVVVTVFVWRTGDDLSDNQASLISFVSWLIGVLVAWLYAALFISSSAQATPGKRLLGLRVVDAAGNTLGFGRATGRHFAQILSAAILYIGFVMAAFHPQKRALHDLIADTYVVREVPGDDEAALTPSPTPPPPS